MGNEEDRLRHKQNSLVELQRLLAELKKERKDKSDMIDEMRRFLDEDKLKVFQDKLDALKVDAEEMPRNIKGTDFSNRVSNIQRAFDVYRNAHANYMQWSP